MSLLRDGGSPVFPRRSGAPLIGRIVSPIRARWCLSWAGIFFLYELILLLGGIVAFLEESVSSKGWWFSQGVPLYFLGGAVPL